MAITIGNTLLKKLVAESSGVDVREVDKVFAASEQVVRGLLQTGAKVRVHNLGFLQCVETKATRRRVPGMGNIVDVPARQKLVFKEIRTTKNDDAV